MEDIKKSGRPKIVLGAALPSDLELLPELMIVDSIGSSESGGQGQNVSTKATGATTGVFKPGPDSCILSEDLQRADRMIIPAVRIDDDGIYLDRVLTDFEGRLVYQARESANWTKTQAARLLNIKRTTLIEKMKRLGIPLKNANAVRRGEVQVSS